MDIHQQLEASQNRRLAAEDRYLKRLEGREEEAEKMIGEVVRNGRTVFYVYPQGGKYRRR